MGAFWYCQHAPRNSKVKRPAIQRHNGSTLKSWDRKVVILEKRRETHLSAFARRASAQYAGTLDNSPEYCPLK